MDKITATSAHTAAPHASKASRTAKSDARNQVSRQADETRIREAKAERDAQARTVIDSRPSQAHLRFQESLRETHGGAGLKTAS